MQADRKYYIPRDLSLNVLPEEIAKCVKALQTRPIVNFQNIKELLNEYIETIAEDLQIEDEQVTRASKGISAVESLGFDFVNDAKSICEHLDKRVATDDYRKNIVNLARIWEQEFSKNALFPKAITPFQVEEDLQKISKKNSELLKEITALQMDIQKAKDQRHCVY